LSAIFGTAANQMASSGAGSTGSAAAVSPIKSQRAVAAANTSSRYSYWSPKTLASQVVTYPTSGSQLTTFTYTDGATATYLANYDANGTLTGEMVTSYPWQGDTGRTNDNNVMTFDQAGNLTSMFYTNLDNNNVKTLTSSVNSSNWQSETVMFYNSDGTVNRTITGYNDPNVPTSMAKSVGDEIYFRALANK
jgi:hypothetical protein